MKMYQAIRRSACVLAVITLAATAGSALAHGPKGHTNLKVLADDHKAFEAGMKAMTKGLGVKCTACHVKEKFDKDDVAAKEAGRKFMIAVVGEPDKAKRSAALSALLVALEIERAQDEAKVWEAVDMWKKKPAVMNHDGHGAH